MHMRAQSICISFSDLCGQVYNAGPSRAAEAQQDYRAVAADPTDTLAYTPVRPAQYQRSARTERVGLNMGSPCETVSTTGAFAYNP